MVLVACYKGECTHVATCYATYKQGVFQENVNQPEIERRRLDNVRR
jgi:hypothetical protein